MEKGERTNQRVRHIEFKREFLEVVLTKHQDLHLGFAKQEDPQLGFAKHEGLQTRSCQASIPGARARDKQKREKFQGNFSAVLNRTLICFGKPPPRTNPENYLLNKSLDGTRRTRRWQGVEQEWQFGQSLHAMMTSAASANDAKRIFPCSMLHLEARESHSIWIIATARTFPSPQVGLTKHEGPQLGLAKHQDPHLGPAGSASLAKVSATSNAIKSGLPRSRSA